MKRILDCKLFDGYENKEYKIKTIHKIFGEKTMKCVINKFIDDEERTGVVIHGNELFCYKNDKGYLFVDDVNNMIISDGLMEILICR
jgi:hypothetical protein